MSMSNYESELTRVNREADELLVLCNDLIRLLDYNARAKSKAQWELARVTSRLSGILDEQQYPVVSGQ
jgi:replicative DNA helicase